MDEWKDITAYPGLYEVSSTGKIRNKETGVVRKPSYRNGYKFFFLGRSKHRKNVYLHRILAETFIANPMSHKYVDHIDRDKENNTLSNLRWTTQSVNCHNKPYRSNRHGVPGVVSYKGKFKSKIRTAGKTQHIGTFLTAIEASDAYIACKLQTY